MNFAELELFYWLILKNLPYAHLLCGGRRLQGNARQSFGKRGNQVLRQVGGGEENVRQVKKSRLKIRTENSCMRGSRSTLEVTVALYIDAAKVAL